MSDWTSDINQIIKYQRNILLFLLFGSVAIIFLLVFSLSNTYQDKKYHLVVLEIGETGVTRILDPVYQNNISDQERIDRYFILKFIDSVETNRFFSPEERELFITSLASNSVAKTILNSGVSSAVNVKINSWVKMKQQEYLIKFTLLNNSESESKIAIINYEYNISEVTDDILKINPVGFTVTNYKVSNEQ